MAENICLSWFRQKKIPVQIIRPAHTYGPGVNFDDGRILKGEFKENIFGFF